VNFGVIRNNESITLSMVLEWLNWLLLAS
jgi:hypothetical protein